MSFCSVSKEEDTFSNTYDAQRQDHRKKGILICRKKVTYTQLKSKYSERSCGCIFWA